MPPTSTTGLSASTVLRIASAGACEAAAAIQTSTTLTCAMQESQLQAIRRKMRDPDKCAAANQPTDCSRQTPGTAAQAFYLPWREASFSAVCS